MDWKKDRPVWRSHPYVIREVADGRHTLTYHYPDTAGAHADIGGIFKTPEDAMEFAAKHSEQKAA